MAVTPTNLRTNIAVGTTGQVAEVNTLHGAVNALTAIAESDVNAKNHGAIGNGVADDTAAISAAISASGGKRTYLPPGTYITSGITLGPNQSLIGAGVGLTKLKLKSGSNGSLLTLLDASDSLVTDMTLDGNKASNTGSGTVSVLLIDTTPGNLASSYHLTVDRLVVTQGANNGVTMLGKDNPTKVGNPGNWYNWVIQMSNMAIEYCEGYGFFDECSDNRFSNFYLTQNKKADVFLQGSSGNLYSNFKIGEGGFTHATTPPTKTDGACIILDTVSLSLFSNIEIQSSFWDGLYAKDCRYLSFNGVDSQNNDNWGYYFVNCKAITGIATCSQTSVLSNTAGDFYFDSNCSEISLTTFPPSVSGAPAIRIANLGTNCKVDTLLADVVTGSLVNVLANSNFTSTTSWQANNKTATGEVFTWRANFADDQMFGYFTGVLNDRYYVRALVQASSALVSLNLAPTPGGAIRLAKAHTGGGAYEVLSGVVTMQSPMAASAALSIRDARASGWSDINVRYAVCINLTATFGAGREPTTAEMDATLDSFPYSWFSGTTTVLDARYVSTTALAASRKIDQSASAAPTTGTWAVGDVVWNSAAAASGFVGWVCTAAGTPGTWKTFGAISA